MALLNEVEDPRKPSNGTLHNFQEILARIFHKSRRR